MTRQKKEILRKVDEIDGFIAMEMELGCGFTPLDAFEELEQEKWELLEQLATLQHYDSPEAMLYDERHMTNLDELPFH